MSTQIIYTYWTHFKAYKNLEIFNPDRGERHVFKSIDEAASHLSKLQQTEFDRGKLFVGLSFEPPFQQLYGSDGSCSLCERLTETEQEYMFNLFVGH